MQELFQKRHDAIKSVFPANIRDAVICKCEEEGHNVHFRFTIFFKNDLKACSAILYLYASVCDKIDFPESSSLTLLRVKQARTYGIELSFTVEAEIEKCETFLDTQLFHAIALLSGTSDGIYPGTTNHCKLSTELKRTDGTDELYAIVGVIDVGLCSNIEVMQILASIINEKLMNIGKNMLGHMSIELKSEGVIIYHFIDKSMHWNLIFAETNIFFIDNQTPIKALPVSGLVETLKDLRATIIFDD
jgi:hypothetical protein